VHVRGEPSHFHGIAPEASPVEVTLHPRFYIEGVDEADAAFDLIVRAPKKGPFR
jgi:hypothetical protein